MNSAAEEGIKSPSPDLRQEWGERTAQGTAIRNEQQRRTTSSALEWTRERGNQSPTGNQAAAYDIRDHFRKALLKYRRRMTSKEPLGGPLGGYC